MFFSRKGRNFVVIVKPVVAKAGSRSRKMVPLATLVAWYQDTVWTDECEVKAIRGKLETGEVRIYIRTKDKYRVDDLYVQTLAEMLADPDDDGNHPIRIDGQEYLVQGKNMRVERP